MTNITEIIEKAAYIQCACPEKDCGHQKMFKRGVEWAISSPEVLREVLGPALVWINKRYCLTASGNGLWYEMGKIDQGRYTTEELISKYIQETIKPKEDEHNGNS